MFRVSRTVFVALLVVSVSAAVADVPVEIAQTKLEKATVREARRAYFDTIHRTPPGVDWRTVERENRHAAFLVRQADIAAGRGTSSWTELGSSNQAGRTHSTAFDAASGAVYVGSALGGVWKGDLTGSSWTPLSDGLGIGGHRIALSNGSPQVLSVAGVDALYMSTDDGGSWAVPTGLPTYVEEVKRFLVDEGAVNRLYVVLRGREFIGGWQRLDMVLRSTDGGLSYDTIFLDDSSTRFDAWIDRTTGGDLYVAKNAEIYRSSNGGDTFSLVGSIPTTATGVVLTGSEAGAPTLYAATTAGSGWTLWQSTTAGATWTNRGAMSDFWSSALCASITDDDIVMYGGVECWRSTNGGASFAKVNNWWDYYGDPAGRLHADFPGHIECRMIDGQETFFLNTDGGTYTSTDGVATVQNISLSGLGVSQYYTVFTSDTDPYLVVAGAQDQGYQQSDPSTSPYLAFDQLISGDYAQATSTVRDHNWLYTVYPTFVLIQTNEASPHNLQQRNFPAGADLLWLPPLHADPDDHRTVYLGGDHMWALSSGVWSQLPQDFTVAGGSRISAIGIAPSDSDVRYVAVDAGAMWSSHDGGGTWTASTSSGTDGHYFHGHGIAVSPTDPMTAYVSGSGYFGDGVYRTVDGGVSWTPMGDGLPSTMVFALAFDGGQRLYAATEAGPYRYDGSTWVSILGTEAPLTTYWDVESVPALGVMRFATYGRGIWDFAVSDVVAVPGSTPEPRLVASVAPSPARRAATVSFALDGASGVRVEVFDLAGRLRLRAHDGVLDAGRHEIALDLESGERPLESGVYFVRVSTPDTATVQKLPVAR